MDDLGYQLLSNGLAVPRYNSTDGYAFHPNEYVYAEAAEGAPVMCGPPAQPADPFPGESSSGSSEGQWVCIYSPTYDRDWHNDVLCTNGTESHRPYLREWDSFITQDEIMESAQEYERYLNSQ